MQSQRLQGKTKAKVLYRCKIICWRVSAQPLFYAVIALKLALLGGVIHLLYKSPVRHVIFSDEDSTKNAVTVWKF